MLILLVCVILIIAAVRDSETLKKLIPSIELNPTRAAIPFNPLTPSEESPVVHCISPSAYKYIAKVSEPLVASIHWNVFVYINRITYQQ